MDFASRLNDSYAVLHAHQVNLRGALDQPILDFSGTQRRSGFSNKALTAQRGVIFFFKSIHINSNPFGTLTTIASREKSKVGSKLHDYIEEINMLYPPEIVQCPLGSREGSTNKWVFGRIRWF